MKNKIKIINGSNQISQNEYLSNYQKFSKIMLFDIIIVGGGMSGLSLLDKLILSKVHHKYSILIIEARSTFKQDKIWSFWNVKEEDYSSIILNSWEHFSLHNEKSVHLNSPYQYLSIDSEKFYKTIVSKIEGINNITILMNSKVKEIKKESDKLKITLEDSNEYYGFQVFDSRIPENIELGKFDLLQHFKGIHVKTKETAFDEREVILMDFNTDQESGLNFIYVLPLSPKEALIEATWFSPQIVDDKVYDDHINSYLKKQNISNFDILYLEKGIIPMSLSIPKQKNWSNWINIGTRGGLSRPSTGYTFLTTQWFSTELCKELVKPFDKRKIPRFRSSWTEFLDEVLLRVLTKYPNHGPRIFVNLFNNNKPERIIRFLSGNSNLRDELVMMLRIPKILLFTKEAILAIFSRLKFW